MSYHIAIVEDDRDILDNYADVLADKGYRVSPFTNAEDAWNAFNQETPDLAILDIQLKNQPDGGFDL
ncbi:MAG: response regulator, partial [Gammaproteobacteria bacterium]|nr:response regulator [Gammaproteobacteria bacterium]